MIGFANKKVIQVDTKSIQKSIEQRAAGCAKPTHCRCQGKAMKLVHKLVISYSIIITLMVALVALVASSLNELGEATEATDHSHIVIAEAEQIEVHMLNIANGQRGFALTGNYDFLTPYDRGIADFDASYDRLLKLTADNSAQQQRLKDLRAIYDDWLFNAIDPVIATREQYGEGSYGLDQAAAVVARGAGREGRQALREGIAEFTQAEKQLLTERQEAAAETSSLTVAAVLIGGLVVIVVAVISGLVFRRQLQQRLADAMLVASAVADGRLDNHIDEDGSDEIAELLSALANMQTQLRHMMSEIKQAATELSSSSQAVASTAEELSASSDEQSNASGSIATSVQQLSASISHVAENAGEAKQIATESGNNAEQSAKVMEQMVASMNRINEAVREASAQVVELGKQSEQINSIVNVIKSIADQTNLLALNAAIEAARAGEQGRGFSVVADEVRTLAQRTSESTDEIEVMVGKIQQGTQNTVHQMERGVDEVEEGVELAGQTGVAIREIRESFERVLTVVEDISNALQEQNQASGEVAKHVERFSGMAEQNKEATQHTSSTAHQLQALSEQLSRAVERFKV